MLKKTFSLLLSSLFFLFSNVAHAQEVAATIASPIEANTIGALIVRFISFMLSLIGGVSVLFIIIGGFKMVMSNGNEKSAESGKKTVTWAVIGLVVALMAFSIIAIVQNVIGKK
jgi:Type IV secretion system pilin